MGTNNVGPPPTYTGGFPAMPQIQEPLLSNHNNQSHSLAKLILSNTVHKLTILCPLCICCWWPARNSRKSAIAALEEGNIDEFQIQSEKTAGYAVSAYKCGFYSMFIYIIVYIAFLFLITAGALQKNYLNPFNYF